MQDPECLAHTRFRRNDDGTIRDVTSNKRFYNMDLDIVNDRLWNGFYLTPDQFVYDIQCMVHDSKTWPDRDRTNRAEEMLVNTQSYVSEVFDETLILECQRMAEREFERQKILQAERDARAKKKAEREKEKERLRLLAAATQPNQEGQSPTKMIEFPTTGDLQVTEANGDSTSGLGILPNGNGEGVLNDAENHFVPESSPFGSQQFQSDKSVVPSIYTVDQSNAYSIVSTDACSQRGRIGSPVTQFILPADATTEYASTAVRVSQYATQSTSAATVSRSVSSGKSGHKHVSTADIF